MEVKSISLVTTLKWKSINEECLICNNPIGSNCIKCDSNGGTIGECLCVMSNNSGCKHSFHDHCLSQYHKTNSLKCPMCNTAWIK